VVTRSPDHGDLFHSIPGMNSFHFVDPTRAASRFVENKEENPKPLSCDKAVDSVFSMSFIAKRSPILGAPHCPFPNAALLRLTHRLLSASFQRAAVFRLGGVLIVLYRYIYVYCYVVCGDETEDFRLK
jgi:hypothetical protein